MNCQVELRGLGAINDELSQLGVKLVAVSVDPPERSRALAERLRLPYPILSDASGDLIGPLGLWHRGGGPGGSDIALPAQVLIDRNHRVRWKHTAERIHDRLPADRVLATVRAAIASESP